MEEYERKITINDEKNNLHKDVPLINSIYDFPIKTHNPLVTNKGKYAKHSRRNNDLMQKEENTKSQDERQQPSKFTLDESLIKEAITPKRMNCIPVISFAEDVLKYQDKMDKKVKEEKKKNIKLLFKSKTNFFSRKTSEYRNIAYKFQSQYFQYALTIKSIYSQYIAIARCLNTLQNNEINSTIMNINITIKEQFKRDISKYEYKKTLVIDLDETMIYTSLTLIPNYDFAGQTMDSEGKFVKFYLKLRPFLREFLIEVQKLFEIIVYTAAEKEYGKTAIDFIQQGENIFAHILYKDDCIVKISNRIYKNLHILTLNRNLKNIVILDNSISNFSLFICNGIPIKEFRGDPNDYELCKILRLLEEIFDSNDSTEIIKEDIVKFLLK